MTENRKKEPPSELAAVVLALLDTLNDKNDEVKKSVTESLRKIFEKEPKVVLFTSVYFWEMHRKLTENHTTALLELMINICLKHESCLDHELATSVANLAFVELTGNSSKKASELLVALSKSQCSEAIGTLIIKFEPEVIPHHSIIETLGMIAAQNAAEILPFVKVTLSVLVPLLPDMTDEPHKLASTFTLGKLGDAVTYCLTNAEVVTNMGCSKEMYYEEFSSTYEVLTHNWLRTSRSPNLTENILTALVSIMPLLPKSYDEKFIVKLTPALLNLCRKSNVRLPAAKVLAIILSSTTRDDKEILRPFLDQMHQILSELVSITPFEASREVLLTHYEVLQCFRAIVILYPEEGLEKLLQQIKSQSATQRARALVVLRHLVNTLPTEDDAMLQRIAMSLQDSLGDGNTRQVVGAIAALAARQTFPLLPSLRSAFIKFMVLHCGSKSEEAEACEEALFLLSSTVEGAESWLWPSLINILLDDSYAASSISILRALSPLAVKVLKDETNIAGQKDFQSIKVLSRCLELLTVAENRPSVITFLRCSAPLFGHQLKTQWDKQLSDLARFIDQSPETMTEREKKLTWEDSMVEFLEGSVNSEGDAWGLKLADEVAGRPLTPELSILLAAVASTSNHITALIELARTHSVSSSGQSPIADEYSRAVGICAKRNLDTVLKIMEEFCNIEDARKTPVKLLGLMRDSKAAATAEAAKAGLLKAYSEIAKKGDPAKMHPVLEKQVVSWIIKQLNDCKETTTKENGLIALDQVGLAVHPNRLPDSTGLKARGTALATLLALFQSSSGYRPLQLYPLILKAVISMLKIPPALTVEEKEILLETTMDKVIASSPEMESTKLPDIMQQVIEGLGTISSEVVGDSPDILAMFVDILLPWMQSKSGLERRTTLLVLRTTLRSYHDSLKYTYPGGKLEPGKLLGRFISWSADPEPTLRPLVIDCVALALNIGSKHRSSASDNDLNQNLSESKRIIVNDDNTMLYDGIKNVAVVTCERVAAGEVVSFADGLIEGLLYRSEGGVAAGVALAELFRIRGSDIPRSNLYLINSIIGQMRQMENASCKRGAAKAIKALSTHYPQEVIEHVLQQPLPLDKGTKECWKVLGSSLEIGSQTLELLLEKLNNDNLMADKENVAIATEAGRRGTAAFSALASIVAIGHLLNSPHAEEMMSKQLAELFGVLLKYLAGWVHADPPISSISTKFGFVPNREACKISPYKEVYLVLLKIFTAMGLADAPDLANETYESDAFPEENLITVVRTVMECLVGKNEVIINLSQILGKLVTSSLPSQRAIAIAFYTELLGNVKCDGIWLDAVVNTFHEAKSDSSPFVRKLATIGLTKIVYLDANQVEDFFENSLSALLEGLEEPSNAEGSSEVVLESLKGLSVLLNTKTKKPISPRVVLAIKPFIEKENWEMRLAAISALGATALGWQRFVLSPDDDVTDHLLGCIPCLAIKLEDAHEKVAMAARNVLINSASLLQCKVLAHVIQTYLQTNNGFDVEVFLKELIRCLKADLPQRAEEFRNSVVQGYSRSENPSIRSTSALILGLFGEPRPEDIQRLLQLIRDQEPNVRTRAAYALALCFTIN